MSVNGYMSIERELEARREQRKSMEGKEKNFRVEFRFSGGTKHWQYFEKYEDCLVAEDSVCRYGPFGGAIIERPTSKQIQKKGQRGGYSKYDGEKE